MGKRRSQRLIEAKAAKKRLLSRENAIRQTILTLPTEILLQIISNLSLPWKYSLSLTCKYFTELTYRITLPRLEEGALEEFLSTLQKDIPGMYFCYFCYKLRLFDPNLSWANQAHKETAVHFAPLYWLPGSWLYDRVSISGQFFLLIRDYNICFMEANLVMRRHFQGFSHGISLKSLERYESCEHVIEPNCIKLPEHWGNHMCFIGSDIPDFKAQLPGDSFEALRIKKNIWRFFFRAIPKIIDNKLYVARFFTITGPLVSEERLGKIISSMSIPICHHLTCPTFPSCRGNFPTRSLLNCLYVRSELLFYLEEDGKEIEFDPEQDSCLLCSTDYRISLDRGISDNETNLNISIYHCLGPCLSLDDDLWQSTRGPPLDFPTDYTRRLKLNRGSTLRKWHEAARVEDEVEVEVAEDMV